MLKKRQRKASKSEDELELNKPSVKKQKLEKEDFDEFKIDVEIQEKLKERNIHTLFEVQKAVFKPLSEGNNVIVASLTGSGKTLAFILPLLHLYRERFDSKKPKILVISPTRELSIQTADEFLSLNPNKRSSQFSVGLIYGGNSIDEQINKLKRGTDIIVGTPGRIIDMIHRKHLILSDMEAVVLDEADRMLDMGFQKDIQEIFDKIYEDKTRIQVCLFSATIKSWVLAIAKTIMKKEHIFIDLVKTQKGRTPSGVQHLAVASLKSERVTTIADLSKY